MSVRRLPVHSDARGDMVVAEDADIGFPVRRVFAVTGVPAGAIRGEHVVPCRQTMVLISGSATVWLAQADGAPEEEFSLGTPGDTLDLASGVWVRYTLSGPQACVMVFADAPFRPRSPREEHR